MIRLIKRIDKQTAISTAIAIVIGLVATLYFGIYYERKPNISLVVLNSTNVLDVHEPVRNLSISFQGEDIQKEGLNLRILRAKLVNDGGVDILQSYYDRNDIWGMKVSGGEIVDARLLESNSEYIKANLSPRLAKDEGLIQFEKLIFERGDYFILEILVLHGKAEMPKIIPVGKVAGIEGIRVSELGGGSEETNFIKEVFSGSPLVQATRSFAYFMVFVGIAVIILLLLLGLSGLNSARKKVSKKKEFWRLLGGIKGDAKRQYSRQLEILANIYAMRGKESLKTAKHLIEDGSKESRINEWLWRRNPLDGLSPLAELKRQKDISAMEKFSRILAIDEELEERDIAMELVDKRIVGKGENSKIVVDGDFVRLLDEIMKHAETGLNS